ncbi:alpha/beta fold hydrolase [Wenxinia saemankumensis]|uniref:Pimeloyl-ACP methyl ester carboxylesterase n=1 Tax=Wenxinia saemankumensis TaxID=1447782 RepID=A0A1M6C3D7_9RHOB|nr:alpha/beta fold hydrolase [Wenxinia saemankumensis]SHI55530.1 Pimeloyl-ACP methyl ester carboxylesterase [Wenxinia saemankumensis]
MARFLLVHGSCHGAWCWERLISVLEARGHAARAIDLPSHGAEPTPPAEVTLDLYARAVAAAVEPGTILVGHSMGGYPITAAAELVPKRIARLVYLCAYVPRDGHSLADMRRAAPSQPLLDAIRVDAGRIAFTVDPDLAIDRFYHDVPEAVARAAVERLCPQAILPQETALDLRRSPALPRSYIRCRQDRTIPPAFQDEMTEGWPQGTVFDMESAHSPFLSDPGTLADILHTIAEG